MMRNERAGGPQSPPVLATNGQEQKAAPVLLTSAIHNRLYL